MRNRLANGRKRIKIKENSRKGVWRNVGTSKALSLHGGEAQPLFSGRDLKKLIIPLVIEQFLAVAIGMADTVMVASCGEAAVSGVSLVDSINVLLINIFSALATGGSVVAAQYLGRNDNPNARIAAKQLIYVTALMSLLLMAICLVGGKGLLGFVFGKAEADVMDNAGTYFWLSALSYPFLAVYNSGAALFRAMGNSRISMLTSVLMNIVNISGNALLIYGFQMGVAGAAIATLVSRILGAVIMVLLLRDCRNQIFVTELWKVRLRWDMVKNVLRIGVPNGLENGMFQIGKILVQGLITSFGTVAIAANAVAGNIVMVTQIPGNAIGLAMITVVGQCVGARDYEQAKMYIRKLMGIIYLSMILLNLVVFAIREPLVGIFNLSAEATGIANELVIWTTIFCSTFWPLSFPFANGLRAANDVRFTMVTSIFTMWVFRVGSSYILAQYLGWGVLGVWFGMFIDWVVRAACFVFRYLSGKWKNIQFI